MIRSFLHAALLLATTTPAAVQAAGLLVTDAWIREPAPVARVAAGYATLVNAGTQAIEVTSARSDQFGAVELHEMSMRDGVMRMRELPSLTLEPGARAELAPGGLHLMLLRPVRAMRAGERATIVFTLADGATVDAAFDVRAATPR